MGLGGSLQASHWLYLPVPICTRAPQPCGCQGNAPGSGAGRGKSGEAVLGLQTWKRGTCTQAGLQQLRATKELGEREQTTQPAPDLGAICAIKAQGILTLLPSAYPFGLQTFHGLHGWHWAAESRGWEPLGSPAPFLPLQSLETAGVNPTTASSPLTPPLFVLSLLLLVSKQRCYTGIIWCLGG